MMNDKFIPPRYTFTGTVFGNGGMSEARLFKDTNLDRHVVIKALKPGQNAKHLLSEIAALQQIRSKHVVQIYDVIRDKAGSVVGIVEEYLEGGDLATTPPPSSSDTFLKLVYQVSRGIADIHAHGRVHRDIKRENMKFDGEGCLKIFDFGLAKDLLGSSKTTNLMGTRGYIPPECFVASASGHVYFNEGVDTFAFGSTCLAISQRNLPDALLELPPRLPHPSVGFDNVTPKIPSDVVQILNRCFDPDPSQRPKMLTVAEAVARHLLRSKHRAQLITGGKIYSLDARNRAARVSVAGQGACTVVYDDFKFALKDVTGSVYVNNTLAWSGFLLPGSCVIVLGEPALTHRRTVITIDVAHPEVTI